MTDIQDFIDSIKDNSKDKDNPKEIIRWAKREIRTYQKLIKILEKNYIKR